MHVPRVSLGLSLRVLGTLAALVSGFGSTTGKKPAEPIGAQAHTLVLGPFQLGEIYDKMPDMEITLGEGQRYKNLRELFAKVRGPKHSDIVKALNGCKLYLIDKTEVTRDGNRRVKRFVDEFAMVVARGQFSFRLKDQEGKPTSIHVRSVKLGKRYIHYADKPPYSKSDLIVELDFERPEVDRQYRHQTLEIVSLGLYWDVNGKSYWFIP
jgi:hypothetical protein